MIWLAGGTLRAQPLEATLTPSNYNGYHISCFGKQDGSLTVSPTGGTPPYTYSWTTGATTAAITDLPAGYYKVAVTDAASAEVIVDITLTEPLELKLDAIPYKYANGMNLSCHNCSNGLIDVSVFYGVPPYSYEWGDGATTQDRSNLETGSYKVTVTDANQCSIHLGNIFLQAPERTDWTMTGNANTNPDLQYIGTSDNKDVVFKANGQESLRLKANGDIVFDGNLDGEGPLFRGAGGILKRGDGDDWPEYAPTPCTDLRPHPYWKTNGNYFTGLCPEVAPKLGTRTTIPLRIITSNQQRMFISTTGKVGIGTEPPSGEIGAYRLFVEGGIVCRDVLVKTGPFPDYVFRPNYALMPMGDLRTYLKENNHLPGIPSAAEVETQGGVEVGEFQVRMLRVLEEQALYILQLEERLHAAEQRLSSINSTK